MSAIKRHCLSLLALVVSALPNVQSAPLSLSERYGQLPLSFEVNRGQVNSQVQFLSRGAGYSLFLTPGEAVLVLTRPQTAQGVVLRLGLVGATVPLTGEEPLKGKVNYFHSDRSLTNLATYRRVQATRAYPGIDLTYSGDQNHLIYQFVVAPGAKLSQIHLAVQGSERVVLEDGAVVLQTALGEIRLPRPQFYQEVKGERRQVTGGYILQGQHLSLAVDRYDPSLPLVVVPVVDYGTFLGGAGLSGGGSDNRGYDLAVDAAGNAYVVGESNANDFPTTSGAFDPVFNPGAFSFVQDGFITKLDPTGTTLVYSTYLGGRNGTTVRAIAVDNAGNAYVTGDAESEDFPTTPGAFNPNATTNRGGAFVTKLNPTGSALVYSTFLRGNSDDFGYGIAVDSQGQAHVTGYTDSALFPTTLGAYDTTYNGSRDAFVTKLNASGSALVYSTFLGGTDSDTGYSIALGMDGLAYVTGQSQSTGSFPATAGAFDTFLDGGKDAFVAKFNAAGDALVYSTLLGGTDFEQGNDLVVDRLGSAYIVGDTSSLDFPTTPGAFATTTAGGNDSFVVKLNPSGSGLTYATLLGGSGTELSQSIALDARNNVYLTGSTRSSNFPTTNGAIGPILGGPRDAYVSVFNRIGSALLYSTFLGGSDDYDTGNGLGLDAQGNVYVTGFTASTDFPTTPGAFDTNYGGFIDGFVIKFGR